MKTQHQVITNGLVLMALLLPAVGIGQIAAADPPGEAPYEEIYYFRVKPSQGFGIQRVYTSEGDQAPLDEVYVVEDGDTVALPRGYHPVAAAPGYELYYLWALAGEGREFGAWSDDPRHAWVRNLEGRG